MWRQISEAVANVAYFEYHITLIKNYFSPDK